MKILSPAGNFESLKMAVYNGADEVYLGISKFNARNNIQGFTFDDLDEIVFFTHIHNVKINLTVNILFNDEEILDAVDLVVSAYNKGVDCFIVQDIGLAYLLHKYYPQIEIHASTQMAICNLEGAQYLSQFGFKRLVLAREVLLDEIKRIKDNLDVEIEYFCQGALCVCFSGNCYLSSYLFDASGNRGKCKQLCRLPYTLKKDGKVLKEGYLLSAKDFNMIKRLTDLKDAGVDVIKIEGRARRPFYVAMATSEYKNAILKKPINEQNLKLAFNRDYTAGYFDGNGKIISNYNNHIGIKIGEVKKVNYGKKFNEIYFTSNYELSKKSSIKLFDGIKEISTISLFDLKQIDTNLYMTTSTQRASVGNNVNIILDYEKETKVLAFEKKKDLKIEINALQNQKIYAKTNIFGKIFELYGDILEPAKNQGLSQNDVLTCFQKNDYFNPIIELNTNNVFIPKSILNEFRRTFYENLRIFIMNCLSHNLAKQKIENYKDAIIFDNFQIVENKSTYLKNTNIIYSPEYYKEDDILIFNEYCKKQNKKMYLDLPNFATKQDVEYLKNIVEKNKLPIIANNYYALTFNTEIIIGGGLNVYNHYSANFYNLPIICSEDSVTSKTKFPYMTLRHCPFKNDLGATCDKCPYKNGYTLTMQNGKDLKIKRKKLSSCTFYLTD